MKKLIAIFCITLAFISIACKADTKKQLAQATTTEVSVSKHFIKVALLLDTSNSMDGLIDQTKAQLWEIVNELSYAKNKNERPNLQIALFEYGNDNLAEKDGFARKILGFTEDLDEVSKELFSLTTNGGSEYCGTVIQQSLDKLDWGNDADDLKMLFIAGNEPFDQGKINYKDAITNAQEKDVVVNTIFCGNFNQGVNTYWKNGATLGYGQYTAIDHNKKTQHIVSPYDDLILQLNIKLNGTYVPYGAAGREKIALQSEQDDNAADYSKANAVSRTVSKGSHLYKNASWDLVDAEEESDFSYSKLNKDKLPDELKNKSTTEIKEYINLKKEERNKIQKEIATLNKKRRDFIATESKNKENGLESAMLTALRSQAKKKNYTWDE